MNLIKDLWGHLKEWSDWGMKDWIKAAIVTVVVLFILYKMTGGGAQSRVTVIIKTLARRCRASGIWIYRNQKGKDREQVSRDKS